MLHRSILSRGLAVHASGPLRVPLPCPFFVMPLPNCSFFSYQIAFLVCRTLVLLHLQHWDAFTNALHDKMALAKAEEDDAKDKAAGDDDNAGDQGEGGDDQLDEDGNENAAALAAGGDLDMAAQEDRDADLADLGDGDQLGNENPDDSLHGSDELNSSLPLGVDVDAADVEDAVDGAEQDGEEEDLADAEQQDNEDMQDNDDEEDVDPEFLGEEDSEDENDEQEQQSAE